MGTTEVAMVIIAKWNVDQKSLELAHEHARRRMKGRWEYRVNGEVVMYGYGSPEEAREAVYTRRKLP